VQVFGANGEVGSIDRIAVLKAATNGFYDIQKHGPTKRRTKTSGGPERNTPPNRAKVPCMTSAAL
jgi:hypothetical protein